jgi:hypothetical protein
MNYTSLPEDLKKKATTLAGELVWTASDACEVIERMCKLDLAVVGVEIWVREGDNPRVIGWSEYRIDFQGDWKSFIQENAANALQVLKNPMSEDALVNLTWLERSELTQKLKRET